MAGSGRQLDRSAAARWVGAIALFAAVTPRLGLGQQSAVVHATVRVVVSVAAESRRLVSGLARAADRVEGLLKAEGSLAVVQLRVVRAAVLEREQVAGQPHEAMVARRRTGIRLEPHRRQEPELALLERAAQPGAGRATAVGLDPVDAA